MEPEYIILISQQRSGKTLNKNAIAKSFKCDSVFDAGFNDGELTKAEGRVLVLANSRPRDPRDRRRWLVGEIITIEQAKAACGDEWVEPH